MDPVTLVNQIADLLPAGRVTTDAAELELRERDWWPAARLRQVRGDELARPLAVALPRTTDEVASLLRWAYEHGVTVITRGLGSGVVGGATPQEGALMLDTSEMDQILELDEVSQLVTVEAGVRGDVLENFLLEHGLTCGHYPQSENISTVGGWVAASGAGQATPGYGPIENRVIALTVVLFDGTVVELKPLVRPSSGPDLRRWILGSEGLFGVITRVTIICNDADPEISWQTFTYDSYADTLEVARRVMRSGVAPRVLRGWDVPDSFRAFGPVGLEEGRCLGMVGIPTSAPGLEGRRAEVARIAAERGGVPADPEWGPRWWSKRLDAVDLFQDVMGPKRQMGSGVVLDTFEVAAVWKNILPVYEAVREALSTHTSEVRCHFSHVYHTGVSLYFTFVVRGEDDFVVEETYFDTWRLALDAAVDAGGSIAHHHGIGRLKAPAIDKELGAGGLELLRKVKHALDPQLLLNPGVLVPVDKLS